MLKKTIECMSVVTKPTTDLMVREYAVTVSGKKVYTTGHIESLLSFLKKRKYNVKLLILEMYLPYILHEYTDILECIEHHSLHMLTVYENNLASVMITNKNTLGVKHLVMEHGHMYYSTNSSDTYSRLDVCVLLLTSNMLTIVTHDFTTYESQLRHFIGNKTC